MNQLYIGTSGWIYDHWLGKFYPLALPAKDRLKFFSCHFKTAEINYSFYHLPRPTTYQNWYRQTPGDFVFSVKASRFITHIKRLKGVKEAWQQFLENSLNLKEKLGPILFQFPPSFQASEEGIKRLENFLKMIAKNKQKLRFAFEFRHKSWCQKSVYELLKKHNVAWVIADSPAYPKAEIITADFVYLRMHGSKVLFASRYTEEELRELAQKIKKWLRPGPEPDRKRGLDVYVYFNNDFAGYAIENARELLKLC